MGYNNGVFSSTRRLQPRYEGEKAKQYDELVGKRTERERELYLKKKHTPSGPIEHAPELEAVTVKSYKGDFVR